ELTGSPFWLGAHWSQRRLKHSSFRGSLQVGFTFKTEGVKMKITVIGAKMIFGVLLTAAVCVRAADAPTVTVKGYVLDSACAFTKGLSKPISKQCATSCANAGSPLVILSDDGTIYWPIADTTPSSGQNAKLLPFAGEKV